MESRLKASSCRHRIVVAVIEGDETIGCQAAVTFFARIRPVIVATQSGLRRSAEEKYRRPVRDAKAVQTTHAARRIGFSSSP